MSGVKLLFSNAAIYAISNLLQRGLAFLLLPLYTSYFSKTEFGAMDQIYQLVMILALACSFGLPHGLKRGFYLDNINADERKELLGVLFIFLLPVIILVSTALWFSSSDISQLLFLSPDHADWIKLAVIFFIVLSLQQLFVHVLRTRQEAKRLATWSLFTFILIAAGNVYFIMFHYLGLSGMLIAYIIGFGLTGLCFCTLFWKDMMFNVHFSKLVPLFAFGFPMLLSLLSRKVLEVSDRYIIPYFSGGDELGIYVMGNKMAMLFEVLILLPFLYAWQPFFYSQSKNENAPKIFATITHYVLIALCFTFLLMVVNQDWLLEFLGSGKYNESGPIIIWLLLSKLFIGVQYCISTGIHLKKKLHLELIILIIAAILNVILNFLLIPELNGIGAAIATAISFLFLLVATFFLSQKLLSVPYHWRRMAVIVFLTAMGYLLIAGTESLALSYLILGGYLMFCVIFDLHKHGDMKQFLELKNKFS